jgi:hypothetical protein
MSFGIFLHNTNGDVLIDHRYVNYGLLRDGSCTIANASYTYATNKPAALVCTFSSPITSVNPPIIALRWSPDDTYLGNVRLYGGPGGWTGFSLTGMNGAGNNITADYRAYSTGGFTGETYGLRLFTDDGRVIYDGGVPPLAITASSIWSDWSYTGISRSFTDLDGGLYKTFYEKLCTCPMPEPGGFILMGLVMAGDALSSTGNNIPPQRSNNGIRMVDANTIARRRVGSNTTPVTIANDQGWILKYIK